MTSRLHRASLLAALLLTACATRPAPEPEPAPPPPPPPPQVRVIELPADALFAFGKAGIQDISEEGRLALDTLARRLAAARSVESVRVVGHSDRIGNARFNEELSLRRAEAVRDYLAQQGVREGLIQVEGRGSAEPVADCPRGTRDIVACLAPDRRVHITVRSVE